MFKLLFSQIYKTFFDLCYWIFPTVPLKLVYQNEHANPLTLFSPDKTNTYFRFWFIVQIISLYQTILELVYTCLYTEAKNLIILLYLGVLFLSKLTAFLWFGLCYNEAHSLNMLLSCLVNRKNIITKLPVSKSIYTILVCTAANLVVLFVVMFPILAFILPCLHDTPILRFVFGQCSTFLFRVFLSASTFVFMVPCAKYGVLVATLFWLSLLKLNKFMKTFDSFLRSFKEFQTLNRKRNLALIYRNLQIFLILNNSCFQNWVLPVFQFFGGTSIIVILYTCIAFQNVLSPVCFALLVFLCAFLTNICVVTMDMGSKPLLYSRKILRHLKLFGSGPWSLRFCISCPKIVLKVGSFHYMDRERVPSFIRFILQRTLFLVTKTKTDTEVLNIFIAFPTT